MDLPGFRALLSPPGQEALQLAEAQPWDESQFLSLFDAMCRHFPPEVARAALETALLRRKATVKFPFAERMYFIREALEQASNFAIAVYRAKRFASFNMALDLGCSIGGDTLALSTQVDTLGVEIDELRLLIAQANYQAIGGAHPVDFLRADLSQALPLLPIRKTAAWCDPSRRSQGQRVHHLRQYQPGITAINAWSHVFSALGVKLSPGVKLEEIEGYNAEVEFISLHGDLKECVLWFGDFKTTDRRATVLPGEHSFSGAPDFQADGTPRHSLPLCEPLAYLYEPDASILRAGLVRAFGASIGAAQLDADIAYLTAPHLVHTPLARAWAVEAWMPFNIKRLRAALRARGVSRVVVKKRGSPLQPEEVIHMLRLKTPPAEGVSRVLFLTHLRGKPIAILCLPEEAR